MQERIPLDYVEGVEETTVWLWPNDPDPVTVRFDREEWRRIEQAAGGDDLEEYIGGLVAADLEEHRDVLESEG
jgi:hypothetical protein